MRSRTRAPLEPSEPLLPGPSWNRSFEHADDLRVQAHAALAGSGLGAQAELLVALADKVVEREH